MKVGPRSAALVGAASLICVGVAMLVGCGTENGGSDNARTTEPISEPETATPEASGGSDHELGESNIKYDALDAIIARGAVAPVIENFSCSWSSETVADCSGTGYDNAAEQSQCGYPLLPCGDFDVIVHAECADGSGHDCEAELELQPTG